METLRIMNDLVYWAVISLGLMTFAATAFLSIYTFFKDQHVRAGYQRADEEWTSHSQTWIEIMIYTLNIVQVVLFSSYFIISILENVTKFDLGMLFISLQTWVIGLI